MSEIESIIETGEAPGPARSEDKLLVLPVNEDSRKITQTLSNETSLKILELLGKKCLSASDIAGELKIPLTTVKYNLDSLVDSELVKVKQIKWSRKGRQVKIYEAMEKLIVLVPGKGFADKLSIISMLQQYIGVIAGAVFAAAGIEYLTAYLRARKLLKVIPGGGTLPQGVPEAVYSATPTSAPVSALPPEAVVAPESLFVASNMSADNLSPKMAETPPMMDDGVFGDVTESAGNETPDSLFTELLEEEEADSALPEDEAADSALPEDEAVDAETPEDEAVNSESPEDEAMEEIPAEAPEISESSPVPKENGLDMPQIDSVPTESLGLGGGGHHLFDVLTAHPGVWFLFGCLFVICLLVIREIYYKKKSM